ncbi:MAG: hypothetical protein H6525_00845 [Actinobacteria bacterium]|nr:hypothetical protein [Actinomycetota bacterium]
MPAHGRHAPERSRAGVKVAVSSALALAAGAGLITGGFLPALGGGSSDPIRTAAEASPATDNTEPDAPPTKAPLTVGTTTPPLPQPEFEVEPLAPGERPPQFVVVSFDGSCETTDGIMRHYLDTAASVDGNFVFNLSGLCVLPRNDQKFNYQPPGRPAGSSDIGFAVPEWVSSRILTWTEAYRTGHEIATHYLGHFCGPNGVQTWSTADWASEIEQFNGFLTDWPIHNPDLAHLDPLPFDPSVIKGGRTPCLEGQRDQMYPAMVAAGYTYEASNSGKLAWPKKVTGYDLWDFPLQQIRLDGHGFNVLSMDYNFLANLNAGQTEAPPAKCAEIEETVYRSYLKAAEALYRGNRAPFFIGNHFNEWACGAFTDSLTRFITDFHRKHPDVRFVTNVQLEQWLEAQDPAVLAQLQALPPQTY